MGKSVYEKPLFLIETFIPKQSVAARCGAISNMETVYVTDPENICQGKNNGDHGHSFTWANLEKTKNEATPNTITDDDIKTWKVDGQLAIFNDVSKGCELLYNSHADNDMVLLGRLLTATNSWSSVKQHRMVIDEIQIPS